MENLQFIDPLLHGIKPLENSTNNLSVKQLTMAGIGSLLVGAVLKKTGHNKAAAVVGGLALPLLSAAVYKKLAK